MTTAHQLGFLAFLSVLTLSVTFPVLPLYLEQLGYTTAEVGLIVGIMNLSLAASELAGGYISDRIGRKAALLWGYLGSALSMLWFALSRGSVGIYSSRILQGIFRGLIWPPLFAEVADAAPRDAHGRTFGLFWFYFSIGILIGPLVGGAIADRYGLVIPFFLGAGLSVVALPILQRVRKGRKLPETSRSNLLALSGEAPGVYLLSGANLVHTLITAVWSTYIPLHAARQGLSPGEIGILFTLQGLAFSFIQVPAGRLADRSSLRFLAGLGILTRAGLVAATPLATDFPSLSVVSLLNGIAGGFVPLTISTWVARIVPPRWAVTAMGVYNASVDAGFFFGPVLGGLVAVATSLSSAFALCAVVGLAGLALLTRTQDPL
ncbi:MAG: MFS transporter [Armatimonadota bacterium]|nr:MFS transporter [Armatimonadota bacterium]